MKAKSLLILSAIVLLLGSCADEWTVRWAIDDEALLPFALAASGYWYDKGEKIHISDQDRNRNTRIMADPDLPVVARARRAFRSGGYKCSIRYNPSELFLFEPELITGILAHEFGHCLGYSDTVECGVVMYGGSDPDCLKLD